MTAEGRARLAAKIAEQDAMRGRPLTNKKRLENLKNAIEEDYRYAARAFPTLESAWGEIVRLGDLLDGHAQLMHPTYGPCDAFGPNGQCAACLERLATSSPAGAAP